MWDNNRILVSYKLWEWHSEKKQENQWKGCFIQALMRSNQALITEPLPGIQGYTL